GADVATVAALRNGSGGENERVACGNTVLLNRSLAGFFTTRAGVAITAGSAPAAVPRPVSFLKRSTNGIVIASMVLRCYAPDFLKRGYAFQRLFDSDHAQRFHSFHDRLLFNHRCRTALNDEPPDRFTHGKRFD